MRCLDSTFLVDVAKGRPAAKAKAKAITESGERVAVPAPVVAEVMVGANFQGGSYHRRMLDFMANLEVIDTTADIALEAGALGAELVRRGTAVGTMDLIIAATAKRSGAVIVSRDTDFAKIPGVAVETY
jgi:predicted nucleic acid-binding protein